MALRRVVLFVCLLLGVSSCGPVTPPPACDFQTCSGCCDASGTCQPGFVDSACGTLGQACQTCVGMVCRAGYCAPYEVVSGGAGATGGGSATGGGTATGGGAATGGGDGSTGGGSATGGGDGSIGGGSATGGGDGVTGGGTATGGGSATGGGTATPEPGDTCANATPLTFDATDVARFNGDMTLHGNDAQASCGDSRDRVFSFTLSEPTWVTISTTGLVHHVRSSCDDASTQLWCSSGFERRLLPAGTWFVWVEASATYQLIVRKLKGDTCENAEALFNGANTTTRVGALAQYEVNLTAPACHFYSEAVDRAYAFTVTTPQRFEAVLTSTDGFLGDLELRSLDAGCATTSPVECSDAQGLRASLLPPGDYVLWVAGRTTGTFTLTASLNNPLPGDFCANAIPLSFNAQGQLTASGDTTGFANDHLGYEGTCSDDDTRGGDLYYSVTMPSAGLLDVSLSMPGAGEPAVSISQGCFNELTCDAPAVGSADVTAALVAGTYVVVVDGASPGAFTLTASTRPLPGIVDTCSTAATPLLSSNGTVTVTGTTSGLIANYTVGNSLGCSGQGLGADGVYVIDHPNYSDLTATVTAANGSNYRPVLSIRESCTNASTQVACAPNPSCPSSSATVTATALPPGRYYLVVDTCHSGSQYAGAYTLTVTQ